MSREKLKDKMISAKPEARIKNGGLVQGIKLPFCFLKTTFDATENAKRRKA